MVGATDMNKNSSRSHAIFTVHYTEKGHGGETNCKMNIVDLAGSERLERTNAEGSRAQEGVAINKSLSALGRVIGILADNCVKGRKEHVPYRESVLTQILAESLGGNSQTYLIAALSPAGFNYDQTLSTLRFAQNASKISTQAKKNVQVKGTDKELRQQIERLRQELEKAMQVQAAKPVQPSQPQIQTVYNNNMEVLQIQDQGKVLWLQDEIQKLRDAMKSKDEIQKELEEERKQKRELEQSRDEAMRQAGLSTAEVDSQLPYIINISEDPTVAGLLIYRLREGETTIGTAEAPDNSIKLNALGIDRRHCSILHQKDEFFILPKPQSKVFVNGFQVKEQQPIKHLDRIVLGHANKFKLVVPGTKTTQQQHSPQDKFGEFLTDKLNTDSAQSKSMKQLIESMEGSLSKNAFLRFLQTLKEIYADVDSANEYSLQRYRKFPTRDRNVAFRFNFMVDEGEAESVVSCFHKEDGRLLFLWSYDKFKRRLAEMQEWWSGQKNQEKSYEQFDPWFDATDTFILDQERLSNMTLSQMRDFYSRKQDTLQQTVTALNKEQTQILNSLIEHFEPGLTKESLEDYCEQYCDYYFRQDEKFIDKQKLSKIEELRKDPQVHQTMKRWMETITEFERARKDNDNCNALRTKFANKKSKKGNQDDSALKEENERLKAQLKSLKERVEKQQSGSGHANGALNANGASNANGSTQQMVQKQYAEIEMLQEELKRRALEMKKLKG